MIFHSYVNVYQRVGDFDVDLMGLLMGFDVDSMVIYGWKRDDI